MSIPDTAGPLVVSWPASIESSLIKPDVAVTDGSADVVHLRLRVAHHRPWPSTRRATLPVPVAERRRFELAGRSQLLPPQAGLLLLVLWLAANGLWTALIPDGPGRRTAHLVHDNIVLGTLFVFVVGFLALYRPTPRQYPRLGEGDRILVDGAHPGYAAGLTALNPLHAAWISAAPAVINRSA